MSVFKCYQIYLKITISIFIVGQSIRLIRQGIETIRQKKRIPAYKS